jgi:hypothetical protein
MRYHIKLFPYVEVSGERVHLEVLQSELLKFSVGSTLRPKFLRIQGIENCSIMTRFLDKNKYQWWFECMELFVDKQHLSRKGIKTILNKRPFVKNQGLRVKDQEIIHALMSA